MTVFTREGLAALIKRKKIFTATIIAAAAAAVVICTALCFIVTPENLITIEIVDSFVFIVCGWYAFGCLFAAILPCNARIAHVKSIFATPPEEIEGTVKKVAGGATVSRYIEATEVSVFAEESRLCYWDNALGDCPLSEGERVRFKLTRGFIFEYEVVGDAG